MLLPPPDAWRINVAAVIMDAQGNVLIASTSPEGKNWHFPQGGVRRKESLLDAVKREVQEEVGLSPDAYRVLCSIGGFRYRYKEQNEKSARWKGQEQTYYLLLCHDKQPAISIENTPEFACARWVPYKELQPEMFVSFKRPIIEQVLQIFFPPSLPIKKMRQYHNSMLTPDRYRIKEDEAFSFEERQADDRSLFAGSKDAAFPQMRDLRENIRHLHDAITRKRKGRLLIIFDGLSGSGCSSSLRSLASCMNPFGLSVEQFTEHDLRAMDDYDFLRPFSMRTPRVGQVVIFDHSLYDLLFQRYHRGEMTEAKLRRRMKHLSNFESMLCDEGTSIIKIFLHVSYEEQQRRIEKRLNDPSARPEHIDFHLPLLEDWQKKMDVAQEVLNMGSKSQAHSWYVLPADRKWYRELCVLRIVAEKLQNMLLHDEE